MSENPTSSLEPSTLEPLKQEEDFVWTAKTIVLSTVLFGLAGVAEIVGGWLVWQSLRRKPIRAPWWYAVLGGLTLVVYGFIPCGQPMDSFGRIYAAYGGYFIVLSFLFGWLLDGDQPDIGDVVGGIISLVGVGIILYWPR